MALQSLLNLLFPDREARQHPRDRGPGAADARPVRPQMSAALVHIHTGRGNLLTAGGRFVEMAEGGNVDPIVGVFPTAAPSLAFLLAPDLRRLEIRGDGMASQAISAFRLQTDHPRKSRLRHPLAPSRYVGVTPDGVGGPNGWVIFDSPNIGPMERFDCVPLDPSFLSPDFIAAARELTEAVSRPFDAAGLLERLRDGRLRPEFAETLLRVLPREELVECGRLLLHDPETLATLRAAMPENPWFTRVLPDLLAWHTDRQAAQPRVLESPAIDEFAGDAMEGRGRPQAGFVLTGLARAQVRPTQRACLLTTVRNEGAYFLEWLAYHRAIGFDHAFVYTSDNTDRSTELLELLAQYRLITLIHNMPGARDGPRHKMRAHALSLLPQILDFQWAAMIDADEFIGFDTRRYSNIGELLAWHETQPIDALSLCWVIFAASSGQDWRDAPTLQRFTRREPQPNNHVKTLFRPAKFCNARSHFPHTTHLVPAIWRNETGALHHHPGITGHDPSFSANPSADLAWVNHYWMRSAPELLWKISRGHPDEAGRDPQRRAAMAADLLTKFLSFSSRANMIDDRRILSCAGAMPDELGRMRALPGVAAAETRTREAFVARMGTLVQKFVQPVPEGLQEPEAFTAFRAVLQAMQKEMVVGR